MEKHLLCRLFFAAMLVFSAAVKAQEFPTKPIRIVVPFPPGGVTDILARLVADRFRERWNFPMIVENRAGASGNIGAEFVAKAAPDGYTLMVTPPSPLVTNKSLFSNLAYDPDAFVPVSIISMAPMVLLVNQKVPADSVRDLIALLKAYPGKFNYASTGSGGTTHLTAELFLSMAGVKAGQVPYKGVAPAVVDLLSGQVDMMFTEIGNALSHVRAGKMRVLAVGSEKRSPMVGNVPAMSEVLPGFVAMVWVSVAAPPGTPPAIVNRLSAAVAEGVKQADFAKRLQDLNNEAIGSTPAEMAEFIKLDRDRWTNVIRRMGIKLD